LLFNAWGNKVALDDGVYVPALESKRNDASVVDIKREGMRANRVAKVENKLHARRRHNSGGEPIDGHVQELLPSAKSE
jgi:hypothetical protein